MSCPMVSFTKYPFITQEGDSAVMLAAWCGHTDIVVELVKAGANLDLQDNV
jgi:ankyrin repeat protein